MKKKLSTNIYDKLSISVFYRVHQPLLASSTFRGILDPKSNAIDGNILMLISKHTDKLDEPNEVI